MRYSTPMRLLTCAQRKEQRHCIGRARRAISTPSGGCTSTVTMVHSMALISMGSPQVAKYLLEQGGASVEAKDAKGKTALHAAAEGGRLGELEQECDDKAYADGTLLH